MPLSPPPHFSASPQRPHPSFPMSTMSPPHYDTVAPFLTSHVIVDSRAITFVARSPMAILGGCFATRTGWEDWRYGKGDFGEEDNMYKLWLVPPRFPLRGARDVGAPSLDHNEIVQRWLCVRFGFGAWACVIVSWDDDSLLSICDCRHGGLICIIGRIKMVGQHALYMP